MRALVIAAALAPGLAFAECAPAPEPVHSLSYGSRYTGETATRSQVDEEGQAELEEALGPIDDFIRELSRDAGDLHEAGADTRGIASCLMGRMAHWARAGAMRDLRSQTARLTVGSRIAGFAMVARQAAHYAPGRDAREVTRWLADLMDAQMTFWEAEGPRGASRGNLRAWAALAAAATADLARDPIMRGWAAWSVRYIVCTADRDGALPQEMSRGRLALHYQLHATAPLTVAAAILERSGMPVASACGGALARIAQFTAADALTGTRSAAITGVTQSYFDGSRELKPFQLAWIEAWLTVLPDPVLEAMAAPLRPLGNSKLGGDQSAIWIR